MRREHQSFQLRGHFPRYDTRRPANSSVDRGLDAHTVRTVYDLEPLRAWVSGPRDRPILLDAKVAPDGGVWWLHEALAAR